MMDKKVRIGVVPVRRDVMLKENAVKNKADLDKQLELITDSAVDLVTIDDICDNGILISDMDEMGKIEKKFRGAEVDGVFFPHMDFGTEESVGRLGRQMERPVLLWGARDESCGTFFKAPVDIQCGLFASSKALVRNNVPFSYIENSPASSERFASGFDAFCRTASVVKGIRRLRVAQVGSRPRQFHSVIYNEDDLMHKFGIEVVPVSIQLILSRVHTMVSQNGTDLQDEVARIRQSMRCSLLDDNGLHNLAALKLTLIQLTKELNVQAISLECWSAFVSTLGIMVCYVVGELTSLGIPVGCETDTMGVITSVLLQSAGYWKEPTFFADLTVRHPQDDNAILLWHCGPFAESLRDEHCTPYLVQGTGTWKLRDGNITIARFDGTGGNYSLTFDEGITVDGPAPNGNYVWYQTKNYQAMEEKFIFGPYIHHVAGLYGHHARVLHEACRYIPHLKSDPITAFSRQGLATEY